MEPVSNGSFTDIKIDPVKTGTEDPVGTHITKDEWDFIHRHESGPNAKTYLAPYIPLSGGKSGITFGQGIDIGNYGNDVSGETLFTAAFGAHWAADPNLKFLATAIGEDHDTSLQILKSKAFFTVAGDPHSKAISDQLDD